MIYDTRKMSKLLPPGTKPREMHMLLNVAPDGDVRGTPFDGSVVRPEHKSKNVFMMIGLDKVGLDKPQGYGPALAGLAIAAILVVLYLRRNK